MTLSKAEARKNLEGLIAKFYQLKPAQRDDASEGSVFGSFVLPLFRDVLGWPTEDVTKFAREQAVVRRKRVDGVLSLESGEKIFVEAKKFGEVQRLSNSNEWTMGPGQLSLPSMATDRTREEQQAINYAFENGGKWAILSNFERLRLFNARRDWLVLAFETPAAYKDDFEQLWQLSWEEIHRSSLDRLDNQRVVKDVDTNYLDFINQQREQLAIDITLNPDENAWAYSESEELRLDTLRAVVQRFLDRLVVVRFAEDHYVINPGSLKRAYDYGKGNPYAREPYYYLREFFRHFDHNHNSALFASSEVDDAAFSEIVLDPLIDKLYQARFRAMPADIIGNTYEEYLAKTIVLEGGVIAIRDNLETRKAQGSYYTPQYIVEFIVDHTLGRYLYGTLNGKPDGIKAYGHKRQTSLNIRDLRVLDSACGSGSFLIYAYQVLAEFYQSEIKRLEDEYRERTADIDSFLDVPIEVREIQAEGVYIRDNYRRLILEIHLYGVDLDPQAAEIAVMNLILRALEGSRNGKKLPLILNQNIKVGNSLVGLRPDDSRLEEHADELAAIRWLRTELIETDHNDPRHGEIQTELESATEDLKREFQSKYSVSALPFHWQIEFPEVFIDEKGQPLDNPGFHFVFGNPPYGAKMTQSERAHFRREYNIGMTNSAGLFMAQSQRLLRRNGGHGLIVPKSFLYASNWRKLRERLLDGLEDLADCEQAWEEVNLEQVIYVHRNSGLTQSYRNLKREGHVFKQVGRVDKRECRRFGFYINDIDERALVLARHLLAQGQFLGLYISNARGAALQGKLNTYHRGAPVIAGRTLKRYYFSEVAGYFDSSDVPEKARVSEGSILVQNIVTQRHLVAQLVNDAHSDHLILDSVNQIQVLSDSLSPQFVLALLNSKLVNWFVYYFLFAQASLTMHFDNPITDRLPLPDFMNNPELVASIEAEVAQIYANRHANERTSQERINRYVYELYGLAPDQISLVEANMP